MKKTFYQLHFGTIVASITEIIVLVTAGYILLNCFSDGVILKNDMMSIVGGAGAIVIALYSMITTMHNRIIYTDNSIKVTGHLGSKSDRTQFKDEIKYSEISNIRIIWSCQNSKKQPVPAIYANAPRLYYEIIMNNGRTKWIFIAPFSQKQRKEMLEIINSKTGKNFSYDALEQEDFSVYTSKKSNKN